MGVGESAGSKDDVEHGLSVEEGMMDLWVADAPWQNFSSMFREAMTAQEAKTGLERAHHLTSSLYFGIAALEAFLNNKMREHLSVSKSEGEIIEELRRHRTTWKLKDWPKKLLERTIIFDQKLLHDFCELRGELTHPKKHSQQIYLELEAVDPLSIVDSVGEYIVRFHEVACTPFPYWVFGWNYLNPRTTSYQIFIINETQFCGSLQALGFRASNAIDQLRQFVWTFDGYTQTRKFLRSLDRCQPKTIFPFMPILCRRWWSPEHRQSCGGVTGESIAFARNYAGRGYSRLTKRAS